MEREPIISRWHKGKEVKDEKIAEGFVSGETGKQRGVRRKIFETAEGDKYYVYKEVRSLKEAKDTMQIYQVFKKAHLPVVDFAKIIRKKVEGQDEFVIAMEDLTENGRLTVIELNQGDEQTVSTKELIRRADIPMYLKIKMVRVLAVIHNNDIYDYHPGISFVLRVEESKDNLEVTDFKIIDYANFYTKEQKEEAERKGELVPNPIEEGYKHDLTVLLRGIAVDNAERDHLVNLYWEEREKGIRTLE